MPRPKFPAIFLLQLLLFALLPDEASPLLASPPSSTITYLRLPSAPIDHLANMDVLSALHTDACMTYKASKHHIVLRPTSGLDNDVRSEAIADYASWYMYEVYKYLYTLSPSSVVPIDVVVHPPLPNIARAQQIELSPSLQAMYGSPDSVSTEVSQEISSRVIRYHLSTHSTSSDPHL